MTTLVAYSSRTGNTRKVAMAIAQAMPGRVEIYPVERSPDPRKYDLVLLGVWAEYGQPDTHSQAFMKRLVNQRIAVFATMGGDPRSPHGRQFKDAIHEMVADNHVELIHVCQGQIDPRELEQLLFTSWRMRRLPVTFEQWARIAEARNHPDEHDLAEVRSLFGSLGMQPA